MKNSFAIAVVSLLAISLSASTALAQSVKGSLLPGATSGGPISIDANTRDIVQDVYIRRAEERGGQIWNVEFDRIAAVRDPGT